MNKPVIKENIFNLFDKADLIYEKFCEKAKERILNNLNELDNFRFMFKITDNIKEDKSLVITIKKLPKDESSMVRGISASTPFHEFIELYYITPRELYNSSTKEFPFINMLHSAFVHEYAHILHTRNDNKHNQSLYKPPSKRQAKRNDWLGYTKDELESYYIPTETNAYTNDYLHFFYKKVMSNLQSIPLDNIEDYLRSELDKLLDTSINARKLLNSKPRYIKSFLKKLTKRIQDTKIQLSEETWQDKFDNFLLTEQDLSTTFQYNSQIIQKLIDKEGTAIPQKFDYFDSNLIKNIPILHKVPIKQYVGRGSLAIIFELENGMILKISIDSGERSLVPVYRRIQDMLHSGEATKEMPMIYDVGYINEGDSGEKFDQFGEPIEVPRFFYILMQKYDNFSASKTPNKKDYKNAIEYDKAVEKYNRDLKDRSNLQDKLFFIYNMVESYFLKLMTNNTSEDGKYDITKATTIDKAYKDIMNNLIDTYRSRSKTLSYEEIKSFSSIVKTMVTSYIKKLPRHDVLADNFGTTYNDPDTFVQFDY